MNRNTLGRAGALAIGLALVGGVAYATIPAADGTIRGCYNTTTGVLRAVEAGVACRSGEKPLTWNQTGPQGPQGVPGAQGEPGPPNTSTGTAFLGTKSKTTITKDPNFATVVTVDLPAGTYLLTGRGTVNRLDHNVGSGISVRCQLTGGGVTLPWAYFSGPTATPVSTATVSLTGRVDLAAPGTASVECAHGDFDETTVEGVGFELLAQGVQLQDND